ncbi:MAG: CBS domain-containing protein [Nanoarchaeota archaeon]|nr:CBS domain-containing protein [Nanoarchaeota archaeon]
MHTNKIWLILVFLVGSILTYSLVFGAQPVLPTLVHGRVIGPDYTPVSGITVTAKFVDSDGTQRSISTQTMTGNEAGYYFFNQGYLQAKAGTEIIIESAGVRSTVTANPGSGLLRAESILLTEAPDIPNQESSGGGGGSGGPGSGRHEGGTTGASTGDMGFGDPDASAEGGEGNRMKLADLLRLSARKIWEFLSPQNNVTDAPISRAKGLEALQRERLAEDMPLQGQIVDEDGNPMPDYEVSLKWEGEDGQVHERTTTTLSEEEAKELGNSSLEGHYWFPRSELPPMPNASVTLETEEEQINITLNSNKNISTTIFHTVPKKQEEQNEETVVEQVKTAATGVAANVGAKVGSTAMKHLKWIILVVILIGVALAIRNWDTVSGGVTSMVDSYLISNLQRSVTKLQRIKAKNIMTKEIITISKETSISEVLSQFISLNIGGMIVVEGTQPVGIITQRDVLKIALRKDIKDIKVKDVMNSPLKTVIPNMNLSEVIKFSLHNNIRKIPVREEKLRGIVTHTDISKELQKFFKEYSFESDLPIVKSAITKDYIEAKEEDNLGVAISQMIKKKADCIVIKHNNKLKGLITERDLIAELYNNPLFLKNTKVGQLMSLHIYHVIPGTYATEANNLMLDKQVKTLAVITAGELEGIITQRGIIELLNSFLDSVLEGDSTIKPR